MMAEAFFWGPNGQRISATQAERNRKTADALRGRVKNPQTYWEGIQSAVGDVGGSLLDWQADQAQEAGRKEVADALAAAQAGDDPSAYMTVLGNEWASPSQSAVASALLNRGWSIEDRNATWARDDANRKADREYERSILDLKHGWDVDAVEDERNHNAPLFDAQIQGQNIANETNQFGLDQAKEGFRTLVDPEERARYGISPDDKTPWQVGADGRLYDFGGKGSAITNVIGDNSSAFSKKADELAATRMDEYVSGGNDAANFMGDLEALADIGRNLNTGKAAEISTALGPFAEMFGIKIEGLKEAQAYDAIVSRMAPAMRIPGAGASSDFDAKQFLKSLPSLGNTPEGNALISDTFRGIQERKIKAAEIARRAQRGDITWQSADAEIAALGDPYSAFKEFQKNRGQGGDSDKTPTASAAAGGPVKISTDDEFDALPAGTVFIGPDGVTRRKQ